MAAAGLLVISGSSCKKEITPPKKTTGISSVATAAQSMQSMSTAFDYTMRIMDALENKNFSFKNDAIAELTTCANVFIDSVSDPHTCVMDFGTGCTNDQGSVRSGIVYIEYNGEKFKDPGTYVHVTFSNFKIDSIEYNGTFSASNNGYNGDGKLNFTLAANITAENVNDGNTISGQAAVDAVMVQGGETKTKEDDLVDFTGYINASTSGGQVFQIDIMNPIELSRSEVCDQVTIGELRIKQSGYPDKYLDYGSGACDGVATEIIEGNSQVVNLADYNMFEE
jgi:hypothetical protein